MKNIMNILYENIGLYHRLRLMSFIYTNKIVFSTVIHYLCWQIFTIFDKVIKNLRVEEGRWNEIEVFV